MRPLLFILRSLVHYRRSHLAALAGAAISTAVLTGALLTGDSVRSSLRGLALSRLGSTDYLLTSRTHFRDALAAAFQPEWKSAPLLSLEAHVTHQSSGRRSTYVDLHGIDQRFYAFHASSATPPTERDAFLSPALARELDAKPGDTLLLRVEEPSAVPREFLYGDKEDTSRVLRFRVATSVVPPEVPDFALRQRQGDVHAVFVPLDRLRKDLRLEDTANAVLLAGTATKEALLRRLQEKYRLEDLGLKLSSYGPQESRGSILEHESTVLDDRTAARALEAGQNLRVLTRPFLTYLANSIKNRGRTAAYALVAGADDATLAELNTDSAPESYRLPRVLLTDWLAADLAAQSGDELEFSYFVWSPTGELVTKSAKFQVSGIIPMRGLAADSRIAPEYPGITDQTSIASWDPPFPIDLKLVTPRDELYWKLHRATPKAWVPLETARELWATRFGALNSIRFAIPPEKLRPVLRSTIDPLESQFTLLPVRQQALAASAGSTNFGEYFMYFSFVLVAAALLLMGLFFRLAIEQRAAEISLLRSTGVDGRKLRGLYQAEGFAVILLGVALGVLLGIGWGWLMLEGLRRWWSGATGTTLLALHVRPVLLAVGAAVGFVLAQLTIWLTVRKFEVLMPRASASGLGQPKTFRRLWVGLYSAVLATMAAIAFTAAGQIPQAGGFFLTAAALLSAMLLGVALWLRRPSLQLRPDGGLWRLAVKNTAWRPGRSLLCVSLVALSAFLLISLESFRQDDSQVKGIWAESLTPIVNDPNDMYGLPPAKWTSFRLRPGDDISCLNLYQPRNPRILGLPEAYYRSKPLKIVESLAQSPETQDNPWLLLDSQLEQGMVPAIVDQNSMQYILHKRLGDVLEIERAGAGPLKLRIVAATAPGLFQSELLISDKDFRWLFPTIPGWRVFLIDAPLTSITELEDALANYGFDAQPLAERMTSFHRVENTYLSTFQALGGFGLLIGVAGLAAVLLRNVLERRAELALLSAVGLDAIKLQRLMLYENLALLIGGLAIGTVCALVAVAPALIARGAVLPAFRLLGLVLLILGAGAASSWLAVRATAPRSLVAALRGS